MSKAPTPTPEYRVAYRPQGPTLERFHLAATTGPRGERKRRFIIGPLGSAKTTTCVYEAGRLMRLQEPNQDGIRKTRGCCLRNTHPDLLATTLPEWRSMWEWAGPLNMGPPPIQKIEYPLPDGTTVRCEVFFLCLDKPKDIRRLRSFNITWAWVNEGREIIRGIFEMLDGRLGRYPRMVEGGPTWPGMIVDTNAFDEDHFLYDWTQVEIPKGRMPGWEVFNQPPGVIKVDGLWVPNPDAENLPNLPPNYYAGMIPGKREDWIKVNLGNQFGSVMDGKAVWPEYNDTTHVATNLFPIEGSPVFVGMDFGLTPAAVFMQRDVKGRILCLDEIVTQDMSIAKFAAEVKRLYLTKYKPKGCLLDCVGDPKGADRSPHDKRTAFQVLTAAGLAGARKAPTNDFTLRREAGAALLSRMIEGVPACLVDRQLVKLRKALNGGYCLRRLQTSAEKYTDSPDKNMDSHVAEAWNYGIMGMGETHIDPKDRHRGQAQPIDYRTGRIIQPPPGGGWSPYDV